MAKDMATITVVFESSPRHCPASEGDGLGDGDDPGDGDRPGASDAVGESGGIGLLGDRCAHAASEATAPAIIKVPNNARIIGLQFYLYEWRRLLPQRHFGHEVWQ